MSLSELVKGNIDNFINENSELRGAIKFINRIITTPTSEEDLIKPNVTLNMSDHKEISISLVTVEAGVNQINPGKDEQFVEVVLSEHDDELTQCEVRGLWYWSLSDITYAIYTFITLTESRSAMDITAFAFSSEEVMGESVFISEPLDIEEEEDDENTNSNRMNIINDL
ncbi:MAG: hypothetical protein M0R77_00370 [Gammaproteobacteria bacterium]|nr:hypothetical protein [Acholeplasmataceae bacterium]MCK9529008.1 hypothetical protein [Gammaproteobacteria bacterium]